MSRRDTPGSEDCDSFSSMNTLFCSECSKNSIYREHLNIKHQKNKMDKEILKEYTQVLLAADNQFVGLAQTQAKTLAVMMSVSTALCLRRNRAKNCFSN